MKRNKTGNYRSVNRQAWANLARQQSVCSQPYGPKEFAHARDWLDFAGWVPWHQIHSVLCIAAGGGQQAPLFASLGYQITVIDLSPEQLQLDRMVAEQNGFNIECIEGDMLDLAALYDRGFDLVYQPISAHYVPDVCRLYQEVHRVLRPGGYYWVEHWSPFQMQLATFDAWDGQAYRIAEPQLPSEPVPWIVGETSRSDAWVTCWHYIHPLGRLIGGLCDAGFAVLRFAEREQSDLEAEPGSEAHLAAYLPPFVAMFAQRIPRSTPPGHIATSD